MKTEEELRTLKRIIENYRDADPKRFADDRLSIDWLWVLNWVLEESGENIDYDSFIASFEKDSSGSSEEKEVEKK